ncbi:MAG: hypothetical protein ACI8UO_005835 [Verrucomicrobiales bacterium]|jgi:hypothetical protein
MKRLLDPNDNPSDRDAVRVSDTVGLASLYASLWRS